MSEEKEEKLEKDMNVFLITVKQRNTNISFQSLR